MSEDLAEQHSDVKALWSQHLSTALQCHGIIPLTNSPDHSRLLTSRYTDILGLAEARFGLRDRSYAILGVEFTDGRPGIRFLCDCGQIVIHLGEECLLEPDRACFQLAHEIIHLLDPTTAAAVSVLEEGLATHFQVWYMDRHYPPTRWPRSVINCWGRLPPEEAEYDAARRLVQRLLETDADAIKRLRSNNLKLSQITAQQIQDMCPALPSRIAHGLALNFYNWKKQSHRIGQPRKNPVS